MEDVIKGLSDSQFYNCRYNWPRRKKEEKMIAWATIIDKDNRREDPEFPLWLCSRKG